MSKKQGELTQQEKVSLRVRQFYNHCKGCGLWTENENLDKDGNCKGCREVVPEED